MKWHQSLKSIFTGKKRAVHASATRSYGDDDTAAEYSAPEGSDDSYSSRPKRRAVSMDVSHLSCSTDKRSSLEQWHEARRVRNSTDQTSQQMVTTDKLTVHKAGATTILNKTYITIKHLGQGTFGKVLLSYNMVDHKLYAVKVCRKSQFASSTSRPQQRCFRRNAFSSSSFSGLMGPASCSPTSMPGLGGAFPRGVYASSNSSSSSCSTESSATAHFLATATGGLDSTRFRTEDVVKEIAILKKLSHPNIVNLVEVIDDPTSDSLLLVMEYVEGDTLEQPRLSPGHWRSVPEQQVWCSVREVLQGLDYLHYNQVVHGDLKPANLLRDSNTGKVKIVDFGSSMMCTDRSGGRGGTAFSTPAFRSPESLQSGYQLSFEIDMWALGVCIYLWVYGCLPFEGQSPFIIYDRIRSADVALPATAASQQGEQQEVSPQLRDLLSKLLDKNPVQRLDVAGAMQHEWVTLGGEMPLCSLRSPTCGLGRSSSQVDVTPEDIESAIRQMEGVVAEQIDVAFDQVKFSDRQPVIIAGEVADKIYLIASGEVEICQDVAVMGSDQPLISGVDMTQADEADTGLMDLDLKISDVACSQAARQSLSCLLDASAAKQQRRHQQQQPSMTQEGKKLLAVRGPGHSFGLCSLQPGMAHTQHVWRASVRARGPVTVFVAKVSELRALVQRRPELEGCVRQMVMQQETDMMVAEAMRQLRLYNDTHCCAAAVAATVAAAAPRAPPAVLLPTGVAAPGS